MIVPITEGEAWQIWKWARERQSRKKPHTSKKIVTYRDDLSIHYDGIKGEYAVHKLFCLPYHPRPRESGDKNAPDLWLPTGESVQVKYRSKRGWQFLLTSTDPDEFTADIGILCWPAETGPEDVEVVGWISRDDFLRHAVTVNHINKPGGERLAVDPEHFHPMQELLIRVYRDAA